MIEPYYQADRVTLYLGDCVSVMRQLPEASVDAVVCDPPYGLEFMGKEWDSFGGASIRSTDGRDDPFALQRGGSLPFGGGGKMVAYHRGHAAMLTFQEWCESWAREAYRVLKPGGYIAAFGGTRTFFRLGVAIEDAGFEFRDTIADLYSQGGAVADFLSMLDPHQIKALQRAAADAPILEWMYGSGFPKSLDVSKAIDKAAGAERTEVVGTRGLAKWKVDAAAGVAIKDDGGMRQDFERVNTLLAPTTAEAAQWQGWGTALKPAHEPICLARKPLIGTVASNVLRYGTGAINIDGTRIRTTPRTTHTDGNHQGTAPQPMSWGDETGHVAAGGSARWPANVILSEEAAALLDATVGELTSGLYLPHHADNGKDAGSYGAMTGRARDLPTYGDRGGPSRFFYTAKASRSEREAGLEALPARLRTDGRNTDHHTAHLRTNERRNDHPTVKPVALMRWLCRLVTPPGGVVLDPFLGSGSTGLAALDEGMRFIGIDMDSHYVEVAQYRITHRHVIEPEIREAREALPQGRLL